MIMHYLSSQKVLVHISNLITMVHASEEYYRLLSLGNSTIAASSLAAISSNCISIITIRTCFSYNYSISSDFSSDDVIRSSPDVTWNSNWPTWKSFYSFPGGLLENPAAPVEEEKEPQEEEADVRVWDIFTQADEY